LPQHLVAHHHLVLLATRVTNQASAFGCLHQTMPTVSGHHQTGLQISQPVARSGVVWVYS